MTVVERENSAPEPTQKVNDPYELRSDLAQPAPETLFARFRFLGPGMLMSAAVVGSGELITTTTMGAKVGFALMWLIVVSTAAKVFIQMELAKIAIVTGEPALKAYGRVPLRFGKASWINVLWIAMDFAKMLQRGGIIGGTVAALSILWPIAGEPLGTTSLVIWTVISLVLVISVNVLNRYAIIERTAFALVVAFTLITAGLALSLPVTDFGWTMSDLGSGFSFSIPVGAAGIAIAVFGLTGVGADEMTTYTYWCLEKGCPLDWTKRWY